MAVFYELVSAVDEQHTTMDVISNEQLVQPSSQEIFRHQHIVVENCPFQLHKFDSFSLRRLFPSGVDLPFIGLCNFHKGST